MTKHEKSSAPPSNAPVMSEPQSVPKHTCQRCGYTLTGLPESHVCPECGLPYDPHSLFLRLGGRSNAGQNAVGALILGVWFVYLGISEKASGDYLPCAVPLLIFCLFAVRRWCRTAGTGRTLTIDRRGVQFAHPDLKPELIPWSRIGSAEISWVTGRLCLRDTRGRKVLRCRYYQLGSYMAMRDVVRQINERAEIYCSAPPDRTEKGGSRLTS